MIIQFLFLPRLHSLSYYSIIKCKLLLIIHRINYILTPIKIQTAGKVMQVWRIDIQLGPIVVSRISRLLQTLQDIFRICKIKRRDFTQ